MNRKLILFAIMLMCYCVAPAQSRKKLLEQKQQLEALLKDYDSKIDIIKNRKFETRSNEDILKETLLKYGSIETFANDQKMIYELTKGKYSKLTLAETYLELYQMFNSLKKPYERETIEKLKNGTYDVKDRLLNGHSDSFIQSIDVLISGIRDYDFALQELDRVFTLIDKKADKTYEILKNEDETVYIDEVPYLQQQLLFYLEAPQNRAAIKRNIQNLIKTIK